MHTPYTNHTQTIHKQLINPKTKLNNTNTYTHNWTFKKPYKKQYKHYTQRKTDAIHKPYTYHTTRNTNGEYNSKHTKNNITKHGQTYNSHNTTYENLYNAWGKQRQTQANHINIILNIFLKTKYHRKRIWNNTTTYATPHKETTQPTHKVTHR